MKMLVIENDRNACGLIERAFVSNDLVEVKLVDSIMQSFPLIQECWPDFLVLDWNLEPLHDETKMRVLDQCTARGIRYIIWAQTIESVPAVLRDKFVGKAAGMDVLRAAIDSQQKEPLNKLARCSVQKIW